MEVLNNYKDYKKYLLEYLSWRDDKDLAIARRLEYLKKNKDKINPDDIQRGKILLHAIDVMDEYSQSNAEDMEVATEFATSQILSLATMGGMILGAPLGGLKSVKNLAKKISKNVHGAGYIVSILPSVIGMLVGTAASFPAIAWATKTQVSASRIGRFKAKQEMLNNPALLVYVDENDAASITNVKLPPRQKKPNIFKFFIQLVKDSKEYNKYRKTELLEHLKFNQAVEKLDLSPQQLAEAKNLQMNVFKTFNKVDEKSQTYSESVEAVGEMTKQGVTLFGSLVAMGISVITMLKMLEHPEQIKKSSIGKILGKTMLPFAFISLPVIAIDVYTTKAQKKASRVADMLALKELEDYRHYVDYSKSFADK